MEFAAILGAALLVLFITWPWLRHNRILSKRRGKPVAGLAEVIGEEAAAKSCVMLYFYSQQCGRCQAMTPRIQRLEQECDNVFRIDVTQHRNWALNLGVSGLPSVAVIRSGCLDEMILGTASDRKLKSLLRLQTT